MECSIENAESAESQGSRLRNVRPFGFSPPGYPEILPPEKEGVDPEKTEDREEQNVHEHVGPIKDRPAGTLVV